MRGGRGLGRIANMKKQQQNAGLLSLQIQKEQEQKFINKEKRVILF